MSEEMLPKLQWHATMEMKFNFEYRMVGDPWRSLSILVDPCRSLSILQRLNQCGARINISNAGELNTWTGGGAAVASGASEAAPGRCSGFIARN